MSHKNLEQEAVMLVLNKSNLHEFGFDEKGNQLRYIRFSAENIKQLRKELALSQDKLASAMDVARTTITHYESGYLDKPSFEILLQLGKVFSELAGYKIVFYADWE
jgi:DNA-binding XRE family transcriptional regulator